MYKAIDDSRNTHLSVYKKKYPKNLDENEKKKIITKIQEVLNEQKIAFIDLIEYVLIKEGSTKDKDIKKCVFDQKILNEIKHNKNIKKIISVSENVEEILFNKKIGNKYIKLFPGKSKRFPKGTDYRKLWKEVFDL